MQKTESFLKEQNPELWQEYDFLVITWQGHMFDLLGKRKKALKHYKKALLICGDKKANWGKNPIMIDKKKHLHGKIKSFEITYLLPTLLHN